MLRRIYLEGHWRYQLLRYVCIGGAVFTIDVGLFQWFTISKLQTMVAATLAYSVAVAAHFTLNKFANFRAHDRAIHEQATTYFVVVIFGWLLTLAVISVGVGWLRWAPLPAKLLAVGVNLPVGFLGNRYLTFGPGILARARSFFRTNLER